MAVAVAVVAFLVLEGLAAGSRSLPDEPTSALPADAAVALDRALALASAGRSVVTVAHRVDTALAADVVVVLDGGRVVQRGAPADLLRDDEPFARLVLPVVARELETP